jgi:hypothetical protein
MVTEKIGFICLNDKQILGETMKDKERRKKKKEEK